MFLFIFLGKNKIKSPSSKISPLKNTLVSGSNKPGRQLEVKARF
jgi:hypothetical protein